jgi:hypothetical protein
MSKRKPVVVGVNSGTDGRYKNSNKIEVIWPSYHTKKGKLKPACYEIYYEKYGDFFDASVNSVNGKLQRKLRLAWNKYTIQKDWGIENKVVEQYKAMITLMETET